VRSAAGSWALWLQSGTTGMTMSQVKAPEAASHSVSVGQYSKHGRASSCMPLEGNQLRKMAVHGEVNASRARSK